MFGSQVAPFRHSFFSHTSSKFDYLIKVLLKNRDNLNFLWLSKKIEALTNFSHRLMKREIKRSSFVIYLSENVTVSVSWTQLYSKENLSKYWTKTGRFTLSDKFLSFKNVCRLGWGWILNWWETSESSQKSLFSFFLLLTELLLWQ